MSQHVSNYTNDGSSSVFGDQRNPYPVDKNPWGVDGEMMILPASFEAEDSQKPTKFKVRSAEYNRDE